MKKLYMDTETTGLGYEAELIEIAYAVDYGPITTLVVPHTLINANATALEVNRYYARGLGDRSRWATAEQLEQLSQTLQDGPYRLVGANPRFDAYHVGKLFGWNFQDQPWHYRLADISSYAQGVLGLEDPPGMAEIFDRIRNLGLTIDQPDHSAAGDVHSLRQAYTHLINIRNGLSKVES